MGGELEVLVPDSSTPVMSSDGYSRLSMGPRTQKLAAVTTLCVYLVAVSGLSVRLQVNGTLHFGGARTGNNLCDFKQLQKGLRMKHAGGQGSGLGRGVALDLGGTAQGASELGDVRDAGHVCRWGRVPKNSPRSRRFAFTSWPCPASACAYRSTARSISAGHGRGTTCATSSSYKRVCA